MNVQKLIEKLQKLDGTKEVWVSSNGVDYAVVEDVENDDGEGDVLLLGEIARSI